MDPLTALGLAGNIIQFIDFATKLVSSGVELYRSSTGALRVNDELELIIAEISALTHTLSSEKDLSHNLQRICNEASSLAGEIRQRLEKVKLDGNKGKGKNDHENKVPKTVAELADTGLAGKNRKWESLNKALHAAWTRDEVASLHSRLDSLKSALDTGILLSLRNDAKAMSIASSEHFDRLDKQTQQIILLLLRLQSPSNEESANELRDQTRAVTQILSRMEFSSQDEHRRTREQLWASSGISRPTEIINVSLGQESSLRFNVETSILESLKFQTMNVRQEEVAEAHKQTFQWVFKEPTTGSAWSNFIEWLSVKGGIYWIKGKTGSGKSTLMRYLAEDSRTQDYLKTWASGVPLVICHHFFWNSGSLLQKSEQGLFRSLLHTVLVENRPLIPIVFPLLWARTYSMAATVQPGLWTESWDWSTANLREAFKALLRQPPSPLKWCFFIDGLDEYDGDHMEISNLLKEVAMLPNVKLCVSSRPWIEFETSFAESPSLKLQDLTFADIELYVLDKLRKDKLFRLLENKEPENASSLASEITRKAHGVFLWVHIVVKSLLRGIMAMDSISDLRNRLKQLPENLKRLYGYMFSLIDEVHERSAAEIFQIIHCARVHGNTELSSKALYFALCPETGLDEIASYSPSNLEGFCKELSVRVKVRCADLLEVCDSDLTIWPVNFKVHYLHRTARDFVESTAIWESVQQRTAGSTFNPDTALLKSGIYQMASQRTSSDGPSDHALSLANSAVTFASYADRGEDKLYIPLVAQIDTAISYTPWKDTQTYLGRNTYWANTMNKSTPLGHSNFLTVAIENDLSLYVQRKMNSVEFLKAPIPLLEYVVTGRNLPGVISFSPKSAQILINAGASPNQKHNEYTIWEKALYALYVQWGLISEGKRSAEMHEEAQRVLLFLTTFIQHGASVKAIIRTKKKTLSVLDVVDQTIGESYPAEAKNLVDELKKRGAESYTRQQRHRRLFFNKTKQPTPMDLPWLHHLRA